MNNRGVPDGTYLKSISSENTTIIHYSPAMRLHYSSFIKVLLQNATAPFLWGILAEKPEIWPLWDCGTIGTDKKIQEGRQCASVLYAAGS